MKDVVKILGGRRKEPGLIYELRGIISVLMLLAFIVASPFVFNAVRGVGNEKTTVITVSSPASGENTCTVPETTMPFTENVTTTTLPVAELTSVTEKATETTTEQLVTVTTTRRETTTVRAETTQKHTSATEETTTKPPTTKPTTTKPTTTKPTTTKPTTTESTTTKPTTTESTTSKPTTTKPTTTISPKVSISGGSSGSSTLQFTANGNVSNPSYVWSSSNNNVATVSNGTVTAVGEGTAVITVTMNGQCSASKTVKVGINWGSEYTTNSKEIESSLKKLVSSRTEWKYYSVICGNCHYYDYWGTGVRCNQIYPTKGCCGSFTNWIYNWSTKEPNSLPFKTADHGVRSYIDENNREWYWTTYAGFNANETRTVYTYRQGSYCISSIS